LAILPWHRNGPSGQTHNSVDAEESATGVDHFGSSFLMASDQDPDPDATVHLPRGKPQAAAWGAAAAGWPPPEPSGKVRHAYPLVVRDASFSAAVGLVIRTLPYALARFALLLAVSIAVIVWLCVAIGGAGWLGSHVAQVFGWVWLIFCLGLGGFVWATVLRYVLHMIECGHVAVLTEMITKGSVANGAEGMFAYGRRVVTERFTQTSVLFGLNALVRGVIQSFHATLDWIADLLPIPGLESISSLINLVLKAATRYLDKVIFSYTLARGDDPWTGSREGLIYYCQNAKPVLKTAIWSVVLERVMSVVLWIVLLLPAGLITLALPASVREFGGVMSVIVAFLLAGPIRAAFLQPVFLTMMIVTYHSAIEGQAINTQWDARLSDLSEKFRELGRGALGART
jgi:hypothetical protein